MNETLTVMEGHPALPTPSLTLAEVTAWVKGRRQHSQVGVANSAFVCPLAECAKQVLGARVEYVGMGRIKTTAGKVQTDFDVETFYRLIDSKHNAVEPVLREEVLRICQLMEKYRG